MNKAARRVIIALVGILTLESAGNFYNNAHANESGLVGYNQRYGNDTNSADHTPEASNPSDVHIGHSDSNGFEYKIPGGKTTYYADKNSPLYKQMHNQHENDSINERVSHHSGSTYDESASKNPKIKLYLSKSKPKHNKTIVKTTKPNNKLLFIHRGIMTIGIAVILLGIIYSSLRLIKSHKHLTNYFRINKNQH